MTNLVPFGGQVSATKAAGTFSLLDAPTGIAPTTPADRELVRGKTEWGVYALAKGTTNWALSGKYVISDRSTAVLSVLNPTKTQPALVISVSDCDFYGLRTLWAFRVYDLTASVVQRVTISHIGDWAHALGLEPGAQVEGHAFYANLAGSLTIEDFLARECCGQALQLVNRASEGLPPAPASTVTISRTIAWNCALHPERGSYPISFFNPVDYLTMSATGVLSDGLAPWTDSNGVKRASCGGIFIGQAVKDPRVCKKAQLTGVYVRLNLADRDAVQIDHCDDFEWAWGECSDIGGVPAKISVDMDSCPKGSIRNLSGDYDVVAVAAGKRTVVSSSRLTSPVNFEWGV